MSSIFYLLFCFSSPFAQTQVRAADYYFDGLNGSDSNNGLSPQTAKKTLNALNALGPLIQNKVIAFRDSIIYRRSTSAYSAIRIDYNNVTLTNWYEGGSSKLPRILGSDAPKRNWTNVSGSIWLANTSVGNSTLYFEFADSVRWGIKRNSLGDLTKEFDFYISGDTAVYCYAPLNPDSIYVAVETCNRTFCINIYGDGCRIEYLQLDYAGVGVAIEPVSDNNIVENCRINFQGTSSGVLESCCGEGIQVWSSGNIIRGNYIQEATSHGVHLYTLTGNMSNNLIEYNVVWNCHHSGYDVNSAGGLITNTTIRYNIYFDTPWAAERQEPGYGGQSAGFFCNGNVSDITLAYNLFYNCYQSTCAQISQGSNISVFNNTFANTINYGTAGYGAIWGNGGTTAKNNIFVTNGRTTTNGTFLLQSNNLVYNYGTGGTGIISSLKADPKFIDRINFNFRLQPESPAIDLGTNLGFTHDLDGNPIIGNPDAGSFETMNVSNGSYITVDAGWNFLSIPRLSSSMVADSLFPSRISPVFSYDSLGYQNMDSLQNGFGYVVKFPAPQYIFITGQTVYFPIELSAGWNLIGPFDQDVPISEISTVPSSIINSNFFEFNAGQYAPSNLLKMGKGYWIKTSQEGQLFLNNMNLSLSKSKKDLDRNRIEGR